MTKGIIIGVLGTAILALLVALFVVYTGAYNIAASYPHGALARWLLQTTMKQSVQRHAQTAPEPPQNLGSLTSRGAQLYDEMCVQCHGAPGVERKEVGKGLRPEPPELAKSVPEWSDKELFWIVKHGIRLTGMPAWGETHNNKQVWAAVAFLKTLPSLDAERYKAAHEQKRR